MDKKDLIIATFNGFDGKNLSHLGQFYDENVVFMDPVREVRGLDNLKKYYKSAYVNVNSIQFEFTRFVTSGRSYACYWIMEIQVKGLNSFKKYKVKGHSLLEFGENDKVVLHEDYLDLGEMVYEKIPFIGSLIKKIKSKLEHN